MNKLVTKVVLKFVLSLTLFSNLGFAKFYLKKCQLNNLYLKNGFLLQSSKQHQFIQLAMYVPNLKAKSKHTKWWRTVAQ